MGTAADAHRPRVASIRIESKLRECRWSCLSACKLARLHSLRCLPLLIAASPAGGIASGRLSSASASASAVAEAHGVAFAVRMHRLTARKR